MLPSTFLYPSFFARIYFHERWRCFVLPDSRNFSTEGQRETWLISFPPSARCGGQSSLFLSVVVAAAWDSHKRSFSLFPSFLPACLPAMGLPLFSTPHSDGSAQCAKGARGRPATATSALAGHLMPSGRGSRRRARANSILHLFGCCDVNCHATHFQYEREIRGPRYHTWRVTLIMARGTWNPAASSCEVSEGKTGRLVLPFDILVAFSL